MGIIIIVINGNNLTSYIAEYNLDLISIRIILLRYFILLLILLRQFSSNFHKNLFLIFIILNIRLIFSFSTNLILLKIFSKSRTVYLIILLISFLVKFPI